MTQVKKLNGRFFKKNQLKLNLGAKYQPDSCFKYALPQYAYNKIYDYSK